MKKIEPDLELERLKQENRELAEAVKRRIRELDPDIPHKGMRSMEYVNA